MNFSLPAPGAVARSFAFKAGMYGKNAIIQRMMLEKTEAMLIRQGGEGFTLDLGCGTGEYERLFLKNDVPVVVLDISVKSLELVPSAEHVYPLCADIHDLPLKSGYFNAVILSSVLQWLRNPPGTIQNIYKVLAPKGTFAFAVYLKKSFYELYHVREQCGLSVPLQLPEREDLLDQIGQSGFHITETEDFTEVFHFKSAMEALHFFSDIGSAVVSGKRLSKKEILELCRIYESSFKDDNGVPVTCEIIVGTARKT